MQQRVPLSCEDTGYRRTRIRLRPFHVLAFALVGIPFGWPLVNEGTVSPCTAMARYATALLPAPATNGNALALAMVTGITGDLNTLVAASTVKREWPNVPTPLSCTGLYWVFTFKPDLARDGSLGQVVPPRY